MPERSMSSTSTACPRCGNVTYPHVCFNDPMLESIATSSTEERAGESMAEIESAARGILGVPDTFTPRNVGWWFAEARAEARDVLHLLSEIAVRDAALRDACAALEECIPYVNGAIHSDQPWRVETAQGVMARLESALARERERKEQT